MEAKSTGMAPTLFRLKRGPAEVGLLDVKLNGRPLRSVKELQSLGGPAELNFVLGITPDQRTIIGGLVARNISNDMELVESTGNRQRMSGWNVLREVPAQGTLSNPTCAKQIVLRKVS